MPLVSIRDEIGRAQAGRYALPCFLTFDQPSAEGIFAALAERSCPAMVGMYNAVLDDPNVESFAALLTSMARRSPVNVALMLDHGASPENCGKALKLGFTDVMYDGSKLSLAENTALARRAGELAHAAGGGLEAEIGHVGGGENYAEFGGRGVGFTEPAVAEQFYKDTQCDILAVAIGNAHGVYRGDPKLDLDLLREIRRRVPVPLSLHGGTGLSVEQFRAAIAAGICKVNVFTDLAMSAAERVRVAIESGKGAYFDITRTIRATFHRRCLHFIDTFRPT